MSMVLASIMWLWVWRTSNKRQSKLIERVEVLECEVHSMCRLISKMPGSIDASHRVWAERQEMMNESPSDLAYMKERGFL